MEWNQKSASRAASLGLITVLVVLGGFALWALYATQRVTADSRNAVHMSELYDQARYQIGAEESLDRTYRLEPGPAPRSQHHAAATSIASLFRQIAEDGSAADRNLADHVLAQQARYLVAAQSMFAAVDERQPRRVLSIDHTLIDPLVNSMQSVVDRAAIEHRRRVQRDLANLVHTVVIVRPIVFGAGLVLLTIFWTVLRRFQREKEVSQAAEVLRLEHAVRTDPLTTLGNHRAFEDEFQKALEAARSDGEPFSLARVDIDDFKFINDQRGHLHGDAVLAEIGKLLLQTGHADDSAFRLGGDEFALLLPHTALSGARAAMERLCKDAERRLFDTTISIGVATFTVMDDNGAALSAQADAALYEAKRRGRNGVVTFAEVQSSALIPSSAKGAAVRRLISEENVGVAFQPIWGFPHNLIGYEALARPAPEYELAGPQEAFDIAERIGRAHALDVVCLQAVLGRARALPANTLIFINLSPQSLDHDQFSGPALVRAVETAGISPERVVFEITERSTARLPVLVGQAKRLRDLGFQIALDDVGAGNAGLEMLSHLAVDFIKTDRAMVERAVTDITADAVLAAIIAFARKAGSSVIVEGVETEAMLDYVRDAGAQFAQGYLLGRPTEALPSLVALPRAVSA